MPRKKAHPTRGKTLAKDLLTDSEMARLMKACGDGDAADRNRAFLAMLAATGIRISEALDLEPRDIEVAKRRVHILRGKNGKERRVWMHEDAIPPLRIWEAVRADLGLSECPVFCNLQGGRMHDSYYRERLAEFGRIAKIEKRVHAHGLRHVFACKAHRSGIGLRSLQLQFGHESIATTSQYLEGIKLYDAFLEFDQRLT